MLRNYKFVIVENRFFTLTRKGDEMEKIQVVLASPSDLADERQIIKDLVNSIKFHYI